MELFAANVAQGIYRLYQSERERERSPEHLPRPCLLLFQRFKKAYEGKDIPGLADTLSEHFSGDLYGRSKGEFLDVMAYNLNTLFPLLSPYLTITVLNITTDTPQAFTAVIDMNATLQVLGLSTPITWDSGRLICCAKPEGEHHYWRLTGLHQFWG